MYFVIFEDTIFTPRNNVRYFTNSVEAVAYYDLAQKRGIYCQIYRGQKVEVSELFHD